MKLLVNQDKINHIKHFLLHFLPSVANIQTLGEIENL